MKTKKMYYHHHYMKPLKIIEKKIAPYVVRRTQLNYIVLYVHMCVVYDKNIGDREIVFKNYRAFVLRILDWKYLK